MTESLHRVLATLINVRSGGKPLTADQLQDRVELVRWLRGELAAVESFLGAEQQRVQAAGRDGQLPSTAPLTG